MGVPKGPRVRPVICVALYANCFPTKATLFGPNPPGPKPTSGIPPPNAPSGPRCTVSRIAAIPSAPPYAPKNSTAGTFAMPRYTENLFERGVAQKDGTIKQQVEVNLDAADPLIVRRTGSGLLRADPLLERQREIAAKAYEDMVIREARKVADADRKAKAEKAENERRGSIEVAETEIRRVRERRERVLRDRIKERDVGLWNQRQWAEGKASRLEAEANKLNLEVKRLEGTKEVAGMNNESGHSSAGVRRLSLPLWHISYGASYGDVSADACPVVQSHAARLNSLEMIVLPQLTLAQELDMETRMKRKRDQGEGEAFLEEGETGQAKEEDFYAKERAEMEKRRSASKKPKIDSRSGSGANN